jgi:hypothetical protein
MSEFDSHRLNTTLEASGENFEGHRFPISNYYQRHSHRTGELFCTWPECWKQNGLELNSDGLFYCVAHLLRSNELQPCVKGHMSKSLRYGDDFLCSLCVAYLQENYELVSQDGKHICHALGCKKKLDPSQSNLLYESNRGWWCENHLADIQFLRYVVDSVKWGRGTRLQEIAARECEQRFRKVYDSKHMSYLNRLKELQEREDASR